MTGLRISTSFFLVFEWAAENLSDSSAVAIESESEVETLCHFSDEEDQAVDTPATSSTDVPARPASSSVRPVTPKASPSVRPSVTPKARPLIPSAKPKPKAKGDSKGRANAAVGENVDVDASSPKDYSAMPNPTKPKAKPKAQPKGGGKGKEGGSQDKPKAGPSPKGGPKGNAPGKSPPAKAEPKAKQGKSTVKCLFYPNCNRGDSCPFLHEGAPKAKSEPKAQAKANAKATVATLIASNIRGAEASRTNMTLIRKTFDVFMYPFKAFFASFAAMCASLDKAKPGGSLPLAAPPRDPLLPGVPVCVRTSEAACIASTRLGSDFSIEWIADSGASRSLAPIRSLTDQGIPESLVHQCLNQASEIRFETGNGTTNSTESFSLHGSNFGTSEHRILDSRPIARSLGEVVNSGRPLVWLPGQLPYFVESADHLQVACKGQRFFADRVEENVRSRGTYKCLKINQELCKVWCPTILQPLQQVNVILQ